MGWGACGRRTSPGLSGLGAGFVLDFADIGGVLCRFEKVFDQVHGVVKKIVVRLADVDQVRKADE